MHRFRIGLVDSSGVGGTSGLLGGVLVNVPNAHPRAFGGQPVRNREPYSTTAAGDDSDLTFKALDGHTDGSEGRHARTFCVCTPSFSMPTRMICPGLRYLGGFMPKPTPGGVPVVMISPGSNVMNSLQ